jgi:hypothetical protein
MPETTSTPTTPTLTADPAGIPLSDQCSLAVLAALCPEPVPERFYVEGFQFPKKPTLCSEGHHLGGLSRSRWMDASERGRATSFVAKNAHPSFADAVRLWHAYWEKHREAKQRYDQLRPMVWRWTWARRMLAARDVVTAEVGTAEVQS